VTLVSIFILKTDMDYDPHFTHWHLDMGDFVV
jgi:hypothetical protein